MNLIFNSIDLSPFVARDKVEIILSDSYGHGIHWARPWALAVLGAWLARSG
jgi:hypothetical protein